MILFSLYLDILYAEYSCSSATRHFCKLTVPSASCGYDLLSILLQADLMSKRENPRLLRYIHVNHPFFKELSCHLSRRGKTTSKYSTRTQQHKFLHLELRCTRRLIQSNSCCPPQQQLNMMCFTVYVILILTMEIIVYFQQTLFNDKNYKLVKISRK